jgi:hypothetical protein
MPKQTYYTSGNRTHKDGSSDKKMAEYAQEKQERLAIYHALEAEAQRRKRDAGKSAREEERLRDHFGDLVR